MTAGAVSAPDVAAQAAACEDLAALDARLVECRACPRLVGWREQVAARKRRAFADDHYWGRPVPGFGDPRASLLVVGLAPAAHGANRTGRMFTGDRSGDWLYASLHREGVASRPTATHVGDGLTLRGTRVTAAVRCAPPGNAPTPTERDTCRAWLDRELALLRPTLRAVVALGGFAWASVLASLADAGEPVPRPRPRFGHGARARVGTLDLFATYHPSQQNTFTGRLDERMLDDVLGAAVAAAGLG